jgi:hypothetical protein
MGLFEFVVGDVTTPTQVSKYNKVVPVIQIAVFTSN